MKISGKNNTFSVNHLKSVEVLHKEIQNFLNQEDFLNIIVQYPFLYKPIYETINDNPLWCLYKNFFPLMRLCKENVYEYKWIKRDIISMLQLFKNLEISPFQSKIPNFIWNKNRTSFYSQIFINFLSKMLKNDYHTHIMYKTLDILTSSPQNWLFCQNFIIYNETLELAFLSFVHNTYFSMNKELLITEPLSMVCHNTIRASKYVIISKGIPSFKLASESLINGIPLLVKGYPSSGKNTFVEFVIEQYKINYCNDFDTLKLYKLSMGEHIEAKALLGNTVSTEIPGQFVWIPGFLTKAILEGSLLVIDGLENASQEVMALLSSLLEIQKIYVPPLKKMVGFHPNFRLIVIQNSTISTHNRNILFQPLNLHRFFSIVNLPPINKLDLVEICMKKYDCLPHDMVMCIIEIYEGILGKEYGSIVPLRMKDETLNDKCLTKFNNIAPTHSYLRDFFKFAERVATFYKSFHGNSDWIYQVFFHAYDIFVAHYSDHEIRFDLALIIAARLNIDGQKVKYYLESFKPTILVSPNSIRCTLGCATLKRHVTTDVKPSATALTKTSGRYPFFLTRQAGTVLKSTLEAVSCREPLLLVGETGAGKTSLVEFVADLVLGPDRNESHKSGSDRPRLVVVNMSNQTEVEDLYGCYRPRTVAMAPADHPGLGDGGPDSSTLIRPFVRGFERLFGLTFSLKKNRKYLSDWKHCLATGRWNDALYLMTFTYEAALTKLRPKEHSVGLEIDGEDRGSGDNHRLVGEWESLYGSFLRLKNYVERGNPGDGNKRSSAVTLFTYVEGIILTALKRGDWVLLDEINLASVHTLHSIISVLEDRRVTLVDKGSDQTTEASDNFRLFACMNPPSRRETQKKVLEYGIRSRFTEIYIPELEDRADLRLIVESYLGASAGIEKIMVENIIDFYLRIRSSVNDSTLFSSKYAGSEGEGSDIFLNTSPKPAYTLRSLCRSLQLVASSKKIHGSDNKSTHDHLFQAFITIFSSELHKEHYPALLKIMSTTLFNGFNFDRLLKRNYQIPNADNETTPDPVTGVKRKKNGPRSSNAVTCHVPHVSFRQDTGLCRVMSYDLLAGQVDPFSDAKYIFTPSVLSYLNSLIRILSFRRFPILLQGPTSAGKTSLITWLANATGNKCVRINNHESTEIQDYVGRYRYDGATNVFSFEEGPLTTAMRQGHWIILDELNLAPSEIMEALNRVLDDNRELLVPETCEVVRAHPRFTVFATQNPYGYGGSGGFYGGRKPLSQAFRNRFIQINFSNLPHAEIEMILHESWHLPLSACKKMVAVMKDLGNHRSRNSIFGGREGFITLRDLFKWAKRYNHYQHETTPLPLKMDWEANPLGYIGFMLLGARCRKSEDIDTVKTVLLKHMSCTIDEQILFSDHSHLFKYLRAQIGEGLGQEFGHLYWTFTLRRILILSYVALHYGEPVLLVGDTGCGKTTVCQVLAHVFHQTLYTLNCHQQSDASDFVGSVQPSDPDTVDVEGGEGKTSRGPFFRWRDGLLVKAMKEGNALLLDEVSLAENSVLERLNSVLENERRIVLVEKGNEDQSDGCLEIKAHDNFHILATMNPGGDYGKKELSPALRNRFTEIWCDSNETNSDIQNIMRHNLSWNTIPCDIPRYFIDFATHTNALLRTHRITLQLSTRDIIAFTNFLKSFFLSRITNDDSTAKNYATSGINDLLIGLYHSMAVTFLEKIRINAFARNLPSQSISAILSACHDRLSTQMDTLLVGNDDSNLEESKSNLVKNLESLTISLSADHHGSQHFGIEPFYMPIASNPETSANLDQKSTFVFDTPTTRENIFRIMRALVLNRPLLLEGSPGVGKTSIIQALSNCTNNTLVRINLSEQTDVADLFGSNLPTKNGNFEWRDGPLLRALKNGHWILIDEINLASQSILEALNSCFDHRGEVYVPDLGKTFKVQEGSTKIFASQNPNHQGGGRKMLPKSFLNRFTHVYIKQMGKDDYTTILSRSYPTIPKDVIELMVTINFEVHKIGKRQRYSKYWEFNIRDLVRWCQLVDKELKSDPSSSLLFGFQLIYLSRYRTPSDRNEISKIFDQHTAPINDPSGGKYTRRPFYFAYSAPDSVRIGVARLPFVGKLPIAVAERDKLSLLKQQIPYLEIVGKCLEQNWMPLLVGKSGSGKSSIFRLLSRLTGNRLLTFNVNYNTDTSDLIGNYEQEDVSNVLGKLINLLTHLLRDVANRMLLLRKEEDARKAIQHLQILEIFSHKTFTRDVQTTCVPHVIREIVDWAGHLIKSGTDDVTLQSKYTEILESMRLLNDIISLKTLHTSFVWVDSMLVSALRDGDWILVENANLCSPAILDRLMPLLEPNGTLEIPERGLVDGDVYTVKPHPDFRIIMTMNPANGDISRAMNNRGIEIWMDEITLENDEIEADLCSDVSKILATNHHMPLLLIQAITRAHAIVCEKLVKDKVNAKPGIFDMIKVARTYISSMTCRSNEALDLILIDSIVNCYKCYIPESELEEVRASLLNTVPEMLRFTSTADYNDVEAAYRSPLTVAMATIVSTDHDPEPVLARHLIPPALPRGDDHSWYYRDTVPYLTECADHRTVVCACAPLLVATYREGVSGDCHVAHENACLRIALTHTHPGNYDKCQVYLTTPLYGLSDEVVRQVISVFHELSTIWSASFVGRQLGFAVDNGDMPGPIDYRWNMLVELHIGLYFLQTNFGDANHFANFKKQFQILLSKRQDLCDSFRENHGNKHKVTLFDALAYFAYEFYGLLVVHLCQPSGGSEICRLDDKLYAEVMDISYAMAYALDYYRSEMNEMSFDTTLGILKLFWVRIERSYKLICTYFNDFVDTCLSSIFHSLNYVLKIDESLYSAYFATLNRPHYLPPFTDNEHALRYRSLWEESYEGWLGDNTSPRPNNDRGDELSIQPSHLTLEDPFPHTNHIPLTETTFNSSKLLRIATLKSILASIGTQNFISTKLMKTDEKRGSVLYEELSEYAKGSGVELLVMPLFKFQLAYRQGLNLDYDVEFYDSCMCWNLSLSFYASYLTGRLARRYLSLSTTQADKLWEIGSSNSFTPSDYRDKDSYPTLTSILIGIASSSGISISCNNKTSLLTLTYDKGVLKEVQDTLSKQFLNTFSALNTLSFEVASCAIKYYLGTRRTLEKLLGSSLSPSFPVIDIRADDTYSTLQLINGELTKRSKLGRDFTATNIAGITGDSLCEERVSMINKGFLATEMYSMLELGQASVALILNSLSHIHFSVPDFALDPLIESQLEHRVGRDELAAHTMEIGMNKEQHQILHLRLTTCPPLNEEADDIDEDVTGYGVDDFLQLDHTHPRILYLRERHMELRSTSSSLNNHQALQDTNYHRIEPDMFHALQYDCRKMVEACCSRKQTVGLCTYFRTLISTAFEHESGCGVVSDDQLVKILSAYAVNRDALTSWEKSVQNFVGKLTARYIEYLDVWTPLANALSQMLIGCKYLAYASSYIHDILTKKKTTLWDVVYRQIKNYDNFEGLYESNTCITTDFYLRPLPDLIEKLLKQEIPCHDIHASFATFRLLLWVMVHFLDLKLLTEPFPLPAQNDDLCRVTRNMCQIYESLAQRLKDISCCDGSGGIDDETDWYVMKLGRQSVVDEGKKYHDALSNHLIGDVNEGNYSSNMDEGVDNAPVQRLNYNAQDKNSAQTSEKAYIKKNLKDSLHQFIHILYKMYGTSKSPSTPSDKDLCDIQNEMAITQLSNFALRYTYNEESPIISPGQDSRLLLHHIAHVIASRDRLENPSTSAPLSNFPGSVSKSFDPFEDPFPDAGGDLFMGLEKILPEVGDVIGQISGTLGGDHPNVVDLTTAYGSVTSANLLEIPFVRLVCGLDNLVEKLRGWETGYGSSYPQHSFTQLIERLSPSNHAFKSTLFDKTRDRLEAVLWRLKSLSDFYFIDLDNLLRDQAQVDHKQNVVKSLYQFLSKSPIGQFGTRLKLISMICAYRAASHIAQDTATSEIVDIARAMVRYFETFESSLDAHITTERQKMDNEIGDTIKSFKSKLQYSDFKPLLKSFQTKLNKIQTTFQGIILKNADEIIEASPDTSIRFQGGPQPTWDVEGIEKYFKELLSAPESVGSKEICPPTDVVISPERLSKVFTGKILHQTHLPGLYDFLGSLVVDIKELGGAIAKTIYHKEEKDLAYDLHHKTKQFMNLYKTFYLSGMSYRKGLSLCNKNPGHFCQPNVGAFVRIGGGALYTRFEVFSDSIPHRVWDVMHERMVASEWYYNRSISGLLMFHEKFRKPASQDVNSDHMTRCHGILDYLYHTIVDQRDTLHHTFRSLGRLTTLVSHLKGSQSHASSTKRYKLASWDIMVKLNKLVINLSSVLTRMRSMSLSLAPDTPESTPQFDRHLDCLAGLVRSSNQHLNTLAHIYSILGDTSYGPQFHPDHHSLPCTSSHVEFLANGFDYLGTQLEPFLELMAQNFESIIFGELSKGKDESCDITSAAEGPMKPALRSCARQVRDLVSEFNDVRASLETKIGTEDEVYGPGTVSLTRFVDQICTTVKKVVKFTRLPEVVKTLERFDVIDGSQELTHFQSIPFADNLYQKLLSIALPSQILESLVQVCAEAFNDHNDTIPNASAFDSLIDFGQIYNAMVFYYAEEYLKFHHLLCELLYSSTTLFNNFVAKGFGSQMNPKDTSKGKDGENMKPSDSMEYVDSENCGIGEGEGVKNVSEQIENLDQIEESKQQQGDDGSFDMDDTSKETTNKSEEKGDGKDKDFNEDAIELPENDDDFKDDGNFDYEKNFSGDQSGGQDKSKDELENLFEHKEYDASLDEVDLSENEDFFNNLEEEKKGDGVEPKDSNGNKEEGSIEDQKNDQNQIPFNSASGQSQPQTSNSSNNDENVNETEDPSSTEMAQDSNKQPNCGESILSGKTEMDIKMGEGLEMEDGDNFDNGHENTGVDDKNHQKSSEEFLGQDDDFGKENFDKFETEQSADPLPGQVEDDEKPCDQTCPPEIPIEGEEDFFDNADDTEELNEQGGITSSEICENSEESQERDNDSQGLAQREEAPIDSGDATIPDVAQDLSESSKTSRPNVSNENQNEKDDLGEGGAGASAYDSGSRGAQNNQSGAEMGGGGGGAGGGSKNGDGGGSPPSDSKTTEIDETRVRNENDDQEGTGRVDGIQDDQPSQNKRSHPPIDHQANRNNRNNKRKRRNKEDRGRNRSSTTFDILSQDEDGAENGLPSNVDTADISENLPHDDTVNGDQLLGTVESRTNKMAEDGALTIPTTGSVDQETLGKEEAVGPFNLNAEEDEMRCSEDDTVPPELVDINVAITNNSSATVYENNLSTDDMPSSAFYDKMDVYESSVCRASKDDREQQLQHTDYINDNQATSSQNPVDDYEEHYLDVYHESSHHAQYLTEQLRIILEPTTASRYKGDYKTGKRLNMKKIIDYIASDYRNNKIWLRKTKLCQRDYNIIIALDDSMSMNDNISREMAVQSLSIINKAFALLEAGNLAICKFGKDVKLMQHFQRHLSDQELTRALLADLTFDQRQTDYPKLLSFATEYFDKSTSGSRNKTSTVLNENLLIIISDGRGVYGCGRETVLSAVERILSAGIFVVFVILDNPANKDSIYDIRVPVFAKDSQAPIIKSYLEFFPFPFYIVLKDVSELNSVFPEALKQWFELVTSHN